MAVHFVDGMGKMLSHEERRTTDKKWRWRKL